MKPIDQVHVPTRLAVPASAHDVTRTPAWKAATLLRVLAQGGDIPAAHKHISAVADDPGIDPHDVLRHLAEQLAAPRPHAA